jgi:hypothetical protein
MKKVLLLLTCFFFLVSMLNFSAFSQEKAKIESEKSKTEKVTKPKATKSEKKEVKEAKSVKDKKESKDAKITTEKQDKKDVTEKKKTSEKKETKEKKDTPEKKDKKTKNTDKPSTVSSGDPNTVYITTSGKSYHRENCSMLKKSKTAISLTEAKLKYQPCKKCNPPK